MSVNTQPLLGRRAVVTGASSGIGRAIALELAAAGADVLVHSRGNRQLAEQAAEAVRSQGRKSQVLLADLADPAAVDRFAEEAWDCWNGVDVWINNAGVDVLTGEAARWSFEQKLDLLWKVDVLGTIRLSRTIGQRMQQVVRTAGQNCILNIGWDQAEQGMAGDSGEMFSATKGAVMAFTRSLAQSLAPEVRVNCLAPGWIRTAWGGNAPAYWQQRAERESLLGRWGTPEDVARVACFLVSPAASFVTGQTVPVNGGFRYSQVRE